ncbi:MAG TPA: type III pantothenate kinase, partial [Bacteroidota bacterium]|nr:type III pantothenate kinase [Bacteroidota bacterium]
DPRRGVRTDCSKREPQSGAGTVHSFLMLLALDIGNSTIAAAVFDGPRLRAHARASSTVQRTPEETWQVIEGFLHDAGLSAEQLHAVGISSVVPFLTSLFDSLVRRKLGIVPVHISASLPLGFAIHYDQPTALGSDRICGAAAGYAKYGGPLIVIDFGTATTYGVVGANGDFLGGAISLGVKSTADALHSRTAQLPPIELAAPAKAICTDTVSAMQAGTMFSAIDAVEGMIARLKRELRTDAQVVATGGLSGIMVPLVPSINHHEPMLVLEGVRLLCRRVAGMRS